MSQGSIIWVSHGTTLYRCAPEQLRKVTRQLQDLSNQLKLCIKTSKTQETKPIIATLAKTWKMNQWTLRFMRMNLLNSSNRLKQALVHG